MTTQTNIGLSESELREELATELLRAVRSEGGGAASVHAIAHSIARVIELDHLRIAEQLEHAGVQLET